MAVELNFTPILISIAGTTAVSAAFISLGALMTSPNVARWASRKLARFFDDPVPYGSDSVPDWDLDDFDQDYRQCQEESLDSYLSTFHFDDPVPYASDSVPDWDLDDFDQDYRQRQEESLDSYLSTFHTDRNHLDF